MGHWLDDIEQQENKKKRSAASSARVQDKKFRIQQNYEKNKGLYDAFVQKLFSLVDRVNDLPLEHREIFGKIAAKSKQSRLDNHLFYFSSSRRMVKMEYGGLLRPLKNAHYKHLRIIYFNIAKIMDKVEIEVNENFLEKKRKDGTLDSGETGKRVRKPKGEERDSFHQIYYYDMDNLTDEFAMKIIDWLAFHEDINCLPVIHNGEQRFKD